MWVMKIKEQEYCAGSGIKRVNKWNDCIWNLEWLDSWEYNLEPGTDFFRGN